jgi:hypothetical protein
MPNQERSNVFRFTGMVFTEILRYSRSKNIENIGITEINAIIKKCLDCACDAHRGTINLELVGKIIREKLTG